MTDRQQPTEDAQPLPLSPRGEFILQYPWLPFLAPLIVYMIVPSFFPATAPGDHLAPEHVDAARQTYSDTYLWMYTTMAALAIPLAIFLGKALHLPRFRVSPLAIVVGVVGVVLWVVIHEIGIEPRLVKWIGEDNWLIGILGLAPRDAFNPVDQFGENPTRFWWFMTARFIGLALIVPVIEELMLRGWLMRMVDRPDFWRLPFGVASRWAIVAGTAFPMLYHPEKLPALVWFTLVTWLMLRTKNFWDCVAAHATTNFLLGVWVVWQGSWGLW